jgi:hypothetical protein
LTNVGDEVEAGPDHAIRVQADPLTGEPRPYVHVRRGLEARINRAVFYELAEMAQPHQGPDGACMAVQSNGVWFPIGPWDGAVA